MKKVLLYLLVIICLALAALGILYLLQQEAPAVDAPFLVRTVLLALGIAAGLAAALYVSRRILSLSRAAREEAALDLDELTVKESRSESLPVFLARLSRDLGALSRGQDSFLTRLESLLAKPAQTPPPAAGEVSSAGAVSAEKEALVREMARSLLGAAGREDFYRRALSIAAGVSRSRRASIMLVNTERTGLAVHATLGWDPDETVLRTTFPLDGCLSGSVVREGKRLLVSDIKAVTGRDNRAGYSSSSFIILPFYDNGQVAGVINLTEREESDLYEYDELELLNHLLDLMALALLRVG